MDEEQKLPDFLIRMVDESNELKVKLEALLLFMKGDTFQTLPNVAKQLMEQQAQGMSLYFTALHARITFHSMQIGAL